ncbi:hypothetical protein GW17_00060089 [Ensete ventricosum]|nr:hypothetical protein GW17_00060089 [Ensete ventricosum]
MAREQKSYHSVPAWWRTILKLNATWPGPRSPGCIKLMGGGAQQGSAAPPTAVDVAKCFEERWGSRESEQRVDWSVFRLYPVNAVRRRAGGRREEGDAAMAAGSPTLTAEKKRWWLSNKKVSAVPQYAVVDKYIREARVLISTQEQSNVSAAVGLLDAALALSPRLEAALELRARSLLFLRRFREVADMLQDYIPSFKVGSGGGGDDDSFSSLGGAGDHSSVASSAPISRERANLLSPARERSDGDRSFRCFSVSELKRRLVAGLSKGSDREGQWRYVYDLIKLLITGSFDPFLLQ